MSDSSCHVGKALEEDGVSGWSCRGELLARGCRLEDCDLFPEEGEFSKSDTLKPRAVPLEGEVVDEGGSEEGRGWVECFRFGACSAAKLKEEGGASCPTQLACEVRRRLR